MAKRHKGTTRKRAASKPTASRRESVTSTGADLLRSMERSACERLALDTINALRTRTSRTDGPRSLASTQLDLATQFEAACLYLIDGLSSADIRERLGDRVGVSSRAFESWIRIVKGEYFRRLNARLAETEGDTELHKLRGNLPALAGAMWSEVSFKVVPWVRSIDYADLDNNTRHLLQRVTEGLTGAAKVHTEAEKTRMQTEKLRRQLHADVEREAGKAGGALTAGKIVELIDRVVGLGGAA